MPKASKSNIGAVLGFDFGVKRIGVAVGETLIGVAHPHTVLHVETKEARIAAIEVLVAQWQPVALVVGMPAHEDGSAHPLAPVARKFGNRLRERFLLPVTFVNEFLSSVEAEGKLAEQGVHGRAQQAMVDAVAAQIILQSFFDDVNRTRDAA